MRELEGLIEQCEASIAERDAARQALTAAEAGLAEAQAASAGDAAAARRATDLQVTLLPLPERETESSPAGSCTIGQIRDGPARF